MSFSLQGFFNEKIDYTLPHILCVSGGKDSIFMLEAAAENLGKFSFPPEIIHFNHGLREDAGKDEDLVKESARRFSLPLKVFKINVKKYSSQTGFSVEEAARILRYRKLEDYTAGRDKKGVVLTAHTLSDQAETVILRIIKGTGPSGMRAIRRSRRLKSGWKLERPLLDLSSDKIKKYLKEKKIPFRTDKTNFNTSIPRNFIRHRVIPLLKEINPSLEKNISKSVNVFAEEDEFLSRLAEEALSQVNIKKEKKKIIVELKTIISYNKTLLRRIIRKISPVEMDFNRTRQACKIVHGSGCMKQIDIGGGWKLRKGYENLFFEKSTPPRVEFSRDIKPDGELYIPEIRVKVSSQILKGKADINTVKTEEAFDARELSPGEIIVRSRKPGDRIKLLGGGSKKIKDILIDDKVPLEERNRICVFEHKGEILWLAPLRRSAHAPVDKNTAKTLVLRVFYEEQNR